MSKSSLPEPQSPAGSSPDALTEARPELTRTLFRPIVFIPPDRTVHPPSWLEHVPFAFWLIDVIRPRVFVELGTHAGNSYGALAQAVQHLGLDAAGYAVDTWAGDPQAGFYDESVFAEWKAYHDQRYTAFSTLVRTTFDDALTHFGDGSIDLLNLDGFHSRDAVRHDFESWLPKVSARGVVLLHDINVRERDFGAWEVWADIRATYPTFEFLHGHGLGVAVIGTEIAPELEWLVRANREQAVVARQFFARIGGGVLARHLAGRAEVLLSQHGDTGAGEQRVRESTLAEQREAQLAGQVADATARLEAVERQLADSSAQLTTAATEIEDLTRSLADAETRAGELDEELSRADAARAALESLSLQQPIAANAAQRALAAANVRLRALAARVARTQIPTTRPGRIGATLRALGFTPAQLVRRPRRVGMLLRWLARPRLFKDAHLIAQSGLFDADYYARVAPDTAAAGVSPLAHFVMIGGREGRSPCPLFDAAWYVERYPDVGTAGANPLAHYLRTASREDRNPHPLFSARDYRTQLGSPQAIGLTPLQHYVRHGAIEGLTPHPLFDPAYYAEGCGSLLTGVDPFVHFLEQGAALGINPHPLFDIAFYRTQLKAHERTAANPLRHYLEVGSVAGRRPHPLFDPGFYRRANVDVVASGAEPLIHYLTAGGVEGRLPRPEFDSAWYLSTYPDIADTGVNPLVHYLRFGWLEGRNPSPHFDTRAYLGRYPDVARTGVNPYAHYLESGMAEGRIGGPEAALDPAATLAEPERVRLRAENLAGGETTARVVVCLTHVMPVAPRAGNEYRIYRMLKWLRHSGYVVIPVLAPADGSQPGAAEAEAIAAEFGNAIVCLPDGRLEYVLRDVPDVLRSLDGNLTDRFAAILAEQRMRSGDEREMLRIDRSFCSDALIATVLRLQAVLGPYVLLAEYIWMSRVLPLLDARAFKVIDTIDVFSTRHEKVGQFGVQDLVVERAAEQMRLRRGDVAIAIQHNERQVLETLVPGLPVVTAGVDFDVLDATSAPRGRGVLYVASDNPMNRHGLRDFLRHAWPRVREAVPDAELTVVGAVGASVPVVPPGVSVLGRVDDLEPLYRDCRVVINPAVAGTGVKIKTLEALSRLRRVVAWPNGVDGLSPAVAAVCRTATDWYSFSGALIELLTDDRAAALDASERALLAREGAADLVYAELGQVMDDFFAAASDRPASPLAGDQ